MQRVQQTASIRNVSLPNDVKTLIFKWTINDSANSVTSLSTSRSVTLRPVLTLTDHTYCPSAGHSEQGVPSPGAVVQSSWKIWSKSPSGVFYAHHLTEQYSRLNRTEKKCTSAGVACIYNRVHFDLVCSHLSVCSLQNLLAKLINCRVVITNINKFYCRTH